MYCMDLVSVNDNNPIITLFLISSDSHLCLWNILHTGVEMEQSDPSPLKRFVQAKKKIGEVFEQLLVYVQEGTEFVKGKLNLNRILWNSG